MTRSPTLLLRSLFGEPPTHELPLAPFQTSLPARAVREWESFR